MKRIANLLAALLAAAATCAVAKTDAAAEYANYYAAKDAIEQGDCKAYVTHLDAFLRKHPYVPEKYPDFYFELRYAKKQCSDRISVRGIVDDVGGIDPLPEDPPMVE
jgi:hypothetical protein